MSSDGEMTPSQSAATASRRSVNLRMVAVSAVSFFFGLELKTAQDLFNDSAARDAKSDRDAWGPDEHRRRNRRVASARRGRMRDRGNRDNSSLYERRDPKAERRKRRKQDAARKFGDRNYDDFEPLPWTLPRPTPMRSLTSEEFMENYIAAKRERNIPLPWEEDEKYVDEDVSLPLPIIALNFPKSATLTMRAYFDCGGLTSVHTSTQHGRIGICMLENHLNDTPPLNECDTYRPRVDGRYGEAVPIDFISDIGLQGPPCYYASVHDGGLENIAKHYPNATILLVTRDAAKWYKSMKGWGGMMYRLKQYCGFDGKLHDGESMEYWRNMYDSLPRTREGGYWVNFYHAHTQKIREFAMNHLSMTYVEVELENENIGKILQKYTKVSPECVMYCHPGPFWVKKHNATSKCHPIGQNPADMKNERAPKDEEETDDNTDDDDAKSGESGDEEMDDDV